MSSYLILQQRSACRASLTWMGGKWLRSCGFVRCCVQYLFKIGHSIFVLTPFHVRSSNHIQSSAQCRHWMTSRGPPWTDRQ